MKRLQTLVLLYFCALVSACLGSQQHAASAPPSDPIAHVPGATLRAQGLAYARRGDLIRAQQYLSAALQKGFDETVVIPELVRVCVASSRLRAAVEFARPYLRRRPNDAGMQYVVGTIFMALGDVATAREHFETALRSKNAIRPKLRTLLVSILEAS